MVLVAIHQPNFFPWLGYFDKIVRSDVFILLDDAQFQRSARGTWSNRVWLLINAEPVWVTMPVRRDYHGVRQVREVEIDNRQPWREKLLRTLRASYGRAARFSEIFPLMEPLVMYESDNLAEYNSNAIRTIAEALGLNTARTVASSSLDVDGRATDRLVALVRAVGGTAYLSGDGAAGYQQAERFAEAGLDLIYQNFKHPVYSQGRVREFVPGLSCVDAMMHCGVDGTAALLRGRTPSLP